MTMKTLLTTNWNFARIFRVALGLVALVYAIIRQDTLMGWAGGFLLLMGLANMGCGMGGCATPVARKQDDKMPDSVKFEEIK
ncbi:MAG: hypothetical protein RLY85_328 [Bacteroidota bacterium]|jgi:hypothetical protein